MITTTTTTSDPLLAGLSELLAKARRSRWQATLTGLRPEDRDRQRLLADLRQADVGYRVRV